MEESKAPKKQNWFMKHKILTGLIIFLLLIIIIAAFSSGSDTTQNNSESTQSQEQAEDGGEETQDYAFDNGMHEVGVDVQPGTYRTRGDDGSNFGCYWARLSGFSGEIDDIIANNASSEGSQVITIAPTDKGFETNGCGKWYTDLSQVTDSKTTFSDGIYIVGTDLDAGTFKSSGAEDEYSCYWARLSGFGGEIDEIIANDVGGDSIVTVAASDKGFSSYGCGTWTRQ